MRAIVVIALTALALLATGCTLLEVAMNEALDGDQTTRFPDATPEPIGGIERFEFPPDPNPPEPGSGVLTYVNGGSGMFMALSGPPPNQRFESVTFEFEAGRAGGWVEYVDRTRVTDCTSGAVVPLGGSAVLLVHLEGASQHDAIDPEYLPTHIPGDGRVIVESKLICDSGGVVEWAIGTRGVRKFDVALYEGRVGVHVLH